MIALTLSLKAQGELLPGKNGGETMLSLSA